MFYPRQKCSSPDVSLGSTIHCIDTTSLGNPKNARKLNMNKNNHIQYCTQNNKLLISIQGQRIPTKVIMTTVAVPEIDFFLL